MPPDDDLQSVQRLSEAYRRITSELSKVIVGHSVGSAEANPLAGAEYTADGPQEGNVIISVARAAQSRPR